MREQNEDTAILRKFINSSNQNQQTTIITIELRNVFSSYSQRIWIRSERLYNKIFNVSKKASVNSDNKSHLPCLICLWRFASIQALDPFTGLFSFFPLTTKVLQSYYTNDILRPATV